MASSTPSVPQDADSVLLSLFAVPAMLLGPLLEPRNSYERGELLRMTAIHAGIDPLELRNTDVDRAIVLNERRHRGL